MNREQQAAPQTLVRLGVDAYAQALASSGGKEIEALMREGERSSVCAAIYASPPYDLQVPALGVSRLSVNLTRARVVGGVDGERRQCYEAQRYSMFFAPAGVPTLWRKDAHSRHLNIYFHADALDGLEDGRGGFDPDRPVFNAQLTGIRQLADELAAELGGADVLHVEAADSLARLLLVRLARRLGQPGKAANPLTPQAIAKLRDYVLAHLADRILVADLARETGLSPNRFALAFSACARQSPHQFVLGLRLERATQLLRATDLSLADVAHGCGFANQQHLSSTMRRRIATTPNRYRRDHR